MEEVVRRDVHCADDPLSALPEVEDVHARRRLLEVPEEQALAREGVGEDRAVHTAVQDGECCVPGVVGDQPIEGGEGPIEELADRLAAQEAGVVRNDASERVDELALERVGRDLGEPASLDLAELGPRLDLGFGRHDGGGLERPREPAAHDPIEVDARERGRRGASLRATLLGQRHLQRIHRRSVLREVGDLGVTHEIEAAAHGVYDRTVPGGDIVETAGDADDLPKPPLLILDRVRAFLDEHGLGSGDVRARRIGEGGGSNFTFLLERDPGRFVLRRPPRPPLPPSAHDVVREARLQLALRDAGFDRLPTIVAVCDDESLLGVPFYVMEELEGHVPTDELPPGLDGEEDRRALGLDLVDALVEIHAADVTTPGLAAFARPGSYNERQVRRFAQLWEINKTREIPGVEEVGAKLAANVPEPLADTVVHGDYRAGNTMIGPDDPTRIVAVLDWEMGAIGDPRADLGYMLAMYSEPGGPPSSLGASPVTASPGFPSKADIVEHYAGRSGRDVEPLGWFEALALWKAAVFCEAIYGRYVRGELGAEDESAARFEEGVPLLAESAVRALRA